MSLGFGFGFPKLSALAGGFSPASLFTQGEQGAWYDPADLTTLFQDSAGTTAVTAVEQPVGRMLDKSGRGNHAFQTTSAKRPVLSGRVNLLTKTEDFADGVWVKSNITVTPNSTVAPDGSTTADTFAVTTTSAAISYQDVIASGPSLVYIIYAKQNTGPTDANTFAFYNNTTATLLVNLTVNYSTGVVTQSLGSGATTTNVGNGWWRISIPITSGVATGNSVRVYACFIGNAETGGESAFIWGADLRVTNTGVNLPPYQRVNTSTDYDTGGFPLYLKYDGVDDAMTTNTVDFSATDKMTVWAGVRKLSDASIGMAVESSTIASSTNGAFLVTAPDAATNRYGLGMRGTSFAGVVTTNSLYNAPVNNVLTAIGDIAAPVTTLRANGAVAATSGTSLGTGNYGNYPLFIGARDQTSLYFNGHIYSLIIRGAQSTTPQISATESWVNQRTAAY